MNGTATGYILHRRPYRENSFLADLYTLEHGLFRAVMYKSKRQNASAQLEPFLLYQFTFSGKGELKTVRRFETLESYVPTMGPPLYSALYVNELLLRSEKPWHADVELYAAYGWVLTALCDGQNIASCLRHFEQIVLRTHGVAIDWQRDYVGQAIDPNGYYHFENDKGFVACLSSSANRLKGEYLLQIAEGNVTKAHRKILYSVCRLALIPIVGNQPFEARKLFKK